MKKKLSLNELKVKSFVTSVERSNKIRSGVDTNLFCQNSEPLCANTYVPECPPNEPPKETIRCEPIKTIICDSDGGFQSMPPFVCA